MLHLPQSSSMHQSVPYLGDSLPTYPSSRRYSQYYESESSGTKYSINSKSRNDSSRILPIDSDFTTPVYSSIKEGIRTPPPEKSMNVYEVHNAPPYSHNSSSNTTPNSSSAYARGHIRQFEPAPHSSTVPNMLDCFRTQQGDNKRKRVSPPSRRASFAHQMKEMKEESRGRRSSNAVSVSLTIPSTINASGGSLADFAAQITCFFWFETSTILNKVVDQDHSPFLAVPLIPEALPSMGFRKWVTTILATTQVSQNVILLALLFIFRLKKLNPTVKGKAGSEFRLLTVALMLGNKFLDDNTYTNKTWAEVSGITVGEIHVMEVEFLSNMRYSLFTSEAEWMEWHKRLGKFGEYLDRAQRTQFDMTQRASSISMPPLNANGTAPLPSPPPSTNSSPPFFTAHSPGTVLPPPLALTTYTTNSVSPKSAGVPPLDITPGSRKRAYEDSVMQPPSKRLSRSGPSMLGPQFPISLSISTPAPNPYSARMSVSSGGGSSSQVTTPTTLQPQQNAFFSTSRAMSTVFPPPNTWHTTHNLTPSIVATTASHGVSVSPFSQPRHMSPYPINSNNSSPTNPYSNHHSPSVFLTQRDSPYRPVRHVSTLLAPPVNAEPQHPGFEQMQYQPLQKSRSNYRTGLVPYTQTEMWPGSNWSLQPSYQ